MKVLRTHLQQNCYTTENARMRPANEYLIQVNDKNTVLRFKVNNRDTKTTYIGIVIGTL